MLVRFFFSAVDPADRSEIARVFAEDVKPAFEAEEGCVGVELLVSADENAGGLVEGAVVSRWRDDADVERALGSRGVAESLVRVRQLLRLEPVIRMFAVVDGGDT
ncbi:MAG TPA: antibiotic biosynthesis monooxygenase [Acidimicrobiia bacterium]|nr:antibiotic biosynthesis monooxygenase [Acidimicrobiia bacterium]